ncbi:HD domain-containing protein [Paenibacillus ferrarius]|uniref:HD domain-containing protein n=1 Tax=Paenibacillus ferrarius TaxID=1469647 RepID=UPI003D299C01
MSIQHTFGADGIMEPIYQFQTEAHPVEMELFRSKPVRRLQFLHHFGASALCTPLTHSRLEHTVGVWSLTAHFCPEDLPLRIAAIVHDIGHLPFSHAVEHTLGFNHHRHTEQFILQGEVAEILTNYGFKPSNIANILKNESPLKNPTSILGLDHLDTYLRDTYRAGKHLQPPAELIRRFRLRGHLLEAQDDEAAAALAHCIVEGHRLQLEPQHVAMDALLAKAVTHHCEAQPEMKRRLPFLMDHELLHALMHSRNGIAQETIRVLMFEPHRIQIGSQPVPGSIEASFGTVPKKQPLLRGKPAAETSFQVAVKLAELESLAGTYFFSID